MESIIFITVFFYLILLIYIFLIPYLRECVLTREPPKIAISYRPVGCLSFCKKVNKLFVASFFHSENVESCPSHVTFQKWHVISVCDHVPRFDL